MTLNLYHPAYHDNGSSYNITGDKKLIYDIQPLLFPFSITGISGPILLSHSCKFYCLPHFNSLHHGYFSPNINITLFSLGHLQRNHGTYQSVNLPHHIGTNIYAPDKSLLDNPTLASNNTLPCSITFLQRNFLASSRPIALLGKSLIKPIITSEQIRRCQEVGKLISSLHQPSDLDLIRDLSHGKIASPLTSADVLLYRKLVGPSPSQLAGKYKTAPALPSDHPPATYCGEFIHIDGHPLSKPAIGGHTHEWLCLDEFSGKVDTILTRSNRTSDVYAALDYLFATEYEANGHIPGTVRGDDEAINESLRPLLGCRKPNPVKLQLNSPSLHAQRLERTKQTLDNRALSTLNDLPYILPPKFISYLNHSVAGALNNSIHDRIAPYTPNEIFKGIKQVSIPLPFGHSFMIPQFDDKRKRIATQSDTSYRFIPKMELGVVMGYDARSDSTKFLVDNGTVVSRSAKRLKSLLPSFIPFNWKSKPFYFPSVSLPTIPATSSPISDITVPSSTDVITSHTAPLSPSPSRSLSADTVVPLLYDSVSTVASTPVSDTIVSTSIIDADTSTPNTVSSNNNHFDIWSRPQFSRNLHLSTALAALTSQRIRTGAQNNKLVAQRLATARNRTYRNTFIDTSLSNASTTIEPQPPPPQPRSEVSAKVAISRWGIDKCRDAEAIQLSKIIDKYKSLRPLTDSQLEPNSVYLRSMSLFKQKSNGEINCRIPVDGSRQPTSTYDNTFATTSDITNRQFILSCVLKHAYDTHTIFHSFSGDIPAAFINDNPLTRSDTGGVQFFTRLPKDLINTALANKLMEIYMAHFGIKNANHLFDQKLHNLFITHGYYSTPSDARTYVKFCPHDPAARLIVNFHVDDFEGYSFSQTLTDEFHDILIKRYGDELTWDTPAKGICGTENLINSNGSYSLSMTKYFTKLLHKAGMDNVPPALTPSLPGLFHNDPSSPLLSPAKSAYFSSIVGALIYSFPNRGDFRKEITHLCSRNKAPTEADFSKLVHVLRYLKGNISDGPTFSSSFPHDPPGIPIIGNTDAAHGVHDNGASQSSHTLQIGHNNAPFLTHCKAENQYISPDPMTSEYVSCGRLCKNVVYYRQFAIELGWPQLTPSLIYTDSQSSINLTRAPIIPRKSRHILNQFHYQRSLFANGIILPTKVGSHDLVPDMMTKSDNKTNKFLYDRHLLFNHSAKTSPSA